jgi:salicylate hydroxylase
MNVVAFVSDRSQPPDQRVWKGPWVKPVDQKTMLDDFADWNEVSVNLLKVIPSSGGHL